jgi:hypothetical protein
VKSPPTPLCKRGEKRLALCKRGERRLALCERGERRLKGGLRGRQMVGIHVISFFQRGIEGDLLK